MKGFIKILFIVLSILVVSTYFFAVPGGAEIDDDEVVTFFPSYGFFDASRNEWRLNIQGWIREPEDCDKFRKSLTKGFEHFVKTTIEDKDEFWSRFGSLCADNEGGEDVVVNIGGGEFAMPPSTGGGRIVGKAYLSGSEANALKNEDGWITYSATAKNGREFFGRVQLIDSSGDSVISDIDDTIKITGITQGKKAVLENTFINPPEPAPGMSQHYRQMKRKGMAFHYLTGSPWQLFGFLDRFRDQNGFPTGSFDMKEFRINPLSPEFWDAAASDATVDQKKAAIADIVGSYPNRRFILIGDSGEHDPEIYAWAIETYREQILEVQIRNVTNESTHNDRMRTAFGANIDMLKLIDPNTGETQ